MDRATGKSEWSFWPREHGAYGQLGMPLAAALAMGRPDRAAVCLCAGAIALFVSHEAILVLLGARGSRVRRERGRAALRAGIMWIAAALAAGSAGLWLGGEAVVRAALVPLALVLTMTPLVFQRQEKTLAGEMIAAATLSSAALPVAAAGGVPPATALSVWAVWMLAFGAATSAVHRVISSHKGQRHRSSIAVAVAVTAACVVLTSRSHIYLAAAPLWIASWALILRPLHPRHIRRVGWTLLFGSFLTGAAVVLLVRFDA